LPADTQDVLLLAVTRPERGRPSIGSDTIAGMGREQNLTADAGELDGRRFNRASRQRQQATQRLPARPLGVKQNRRCIASREEVLGNCSRAERGPASRTIDGRATYRV